jgi:hypothetical protein
MTTTAVPPVPTPPATLTPQATIAYVGALALFVLGTLTAAGVTVPSGIATDVNLIVGAAVSMVGALVPLVAHLFHMKAKTAAVLGGIPIEVAAKL